MIEAMKQMANYIDALGGDSKKYRQAIEQAEKQEPVAWRTCVGGIWFTAGKKAILQKELESINSAAEIEPLYTTPPAAQRQPLESRGQVKDEMPLFDDWGKKW